MFDDDNYLDYNNIDDLYYDDDNWDYDDIDSVNSRDWENYYHNIADEIIEE